MEKVHSAQCTDATTECKVLVPNVYNVVTNRAEKAGNTVLGYFYCTHVKTGKGMGGTFSIKCAANGTLTEWSFFSIIALLQNYGIFQ